MDTLRSKLQHVLNPVHLYCRMIKAGIEHDEAIREARKVEELLQPYLYPEKVTKEQAL